MSFLTLSDSHAFQIENGGRIEFSQTGNPGVSASYVVSASVRFEGRGLVVPENEGALLAFVPVDPAAGGSGAKANTIITVCKDEKTFNVFPYGTDQAFTDFKSCLADNGVSKSEGCAAIWAQSKGFEIGACSATDVNPIPFNNEQATAQCQYENLERFPSRRGQGLPVGYFSDASLNHQAYDFAVDLAEQDIIHGDDGSNHARLDSVITRAEAMKVYSRARQDEVAYGDCLENDFADVEWYSWYHRYVQNMRDNDIVHGYQDGLYRPERNINWAELAKVSAISFGFITKFEADDQNTENWYEPYLNVLKDNRVIPTWMNDFEPDRTVTRGDMFALISQILKNRDGLDF